MREERKGKGERKEGEHEGKNRKEIRITVG